MGIQGLLPQLKSIMSPINVEDLRGEKVAVDTYSWLHKGALSCSRHLCLGLPTTRHIEYCMHRVNLLRHHGVIPVLVFDGGLLPIKGEQEMKRAKSRKENLERAMDHEKAGNTAAAFECYQKAVDISPSNALELIQVLRKEKVDYMVAPYEADAQMAFLSVKNLVDAVITEDSDLIPFGCSRIIFKMDKFGQGMEYQSRKLGQNRDIDLSSFTNQMLLEMCILSGCDYLQSLPGMGIKRAHGLIQKLKSYDKVIKHLKYSAIAIPSLYEENFKKAIWAFQHQRVFDPAKEEIVHLLDVPNNLTQDLDFLGPCLAPTIVKGIAEGNIDPMTKLPFEGNTASMLDKSYEVKESVFAGGRKRLELPVQKNVLTNYFCMASLEARRKFRAPKATPKQERTELTTFLWSKDEKGLSSQAEKEKSSLLVLENESYNSQEVCAVQASSPGHRHALRLPCPSEIIRQRSPFSYGNTSDQLHCDDSANSSSEMQIKDMICDEDERVKETCTPGGMPGMFLSSLSEKSGKISSSSVRTECKRTPVEKPYSKQQKVCGDNRKRCDEFLTDELSDHAAHGHSCLCNVGNVPSSENLQPKCPGKRRRASNHHCCEDNSQWESVSPPFSVDGIHNGTPCHHTVREKPVDNLVCDISHLKKYTVIAEKSIESFAAAISSYRYTSSGSRASGLRPPLREVNNSRSVRTWAQGAKHIDLTKLGTPAAVQSVEGYVLDEQGRGV